MTPQIGEFNGWKIKMYFYDHNPPHIHFEKNGKEFIVEFDYYIKEPSNVIGINKKDLLEYLDRNKDILIKNWNNFAIGINEFEKLN